MSLKLQGRSESSRKAMQLLFNNMRLLDHKASNKNRSYVDIEEMSEKQLNS